MNVQNPNRVVTKQDLKDFYDGIYPYLNRVPDAGYTPVGTIIAIMGTTAPTNYLACNGQIVNIKTYPELADYFEQQFGSKNYFGGNGTTTFGIPDLRGEFLRGAGTNSHANQGSGADVSVHQDATAINGWNGGNGTQAMIWLDLSNQGPINPDKKISSTTPAAVNNLSLGSTGLTSISFSTRPTNTSVLYCIATKNIYLNPSLDYSTDEKCIGTWIDDKPLYQKTVQLTNQQFGDTNITKYFNLFDATNLSIISMKATISFAMSGSTYTLNADSILFNDAGTINSLRTILAYDTATNKVRLKTIQAITSTVENIPISNITATIQYTKTTD